MKLIASALSLRPSAQRRVNAALVAAAAFVVLPFTLSSVLPPSAAIRVWPFAAGAKADVASAMLAASPADSAVRRQAAALSIDALRASPIDAVAARSLGVAAAGKGDERQATRAFDYAYRLTRRDVPTQLWFIERAVQRGDIMVALRHYDQAMRTSVSSRDLLIPILTGATATPEVANALVSILQRKPSWWGPFVHMLIGTATDVETPYRVVRALGLRSHDAEHPDFLPRTIDRLVTAGRLDAAFDLYRHNGGGDSRLIRNGSFERADLLPPLDWRYAEDSDLAASRQTRPDGKGVALFLSTASGRGGTVAEQVLRLSPGRYRIALTVGDVRAGPSSERPRLLVRCESAVPRPLAEIGFPASPSGGRSFVADITVPRDCPGQRIVIEAHPPLNGSSDTPPFVDDIRIEPVR